MRIRDLKLPNLQPRRAMHQIAAYSLERAQNLPTPEDDQTALVRKIAYQIIGPCIVASGSLGNILTIAILRTHPFKGVTSIYFLALAISDLLALLLSISGLFHLLNPLTKSYSTAVWYSYFESLFVNIPMVTSVYIIVCITMDRFFSVCYPIIFKKFHTVKYVRIGIIISIAVGVILSLPMSFIREPTEVADCEAIKYNSTEHGDLSDFWVSCQTVTQQNSTLFAVYCWLKEIILSFVPIIAITTLNIMIIRSLIKASQRRRQLRGGGGPDVGGELSNDDKIVVKLLNAIIISFVITMLPAGIFNAVNTQARTTDLKKEIFQAVANDLELLNHALNFYLYVILSKPVRSALPELWKSVKKKLSFKERLKKNKLEKMSSTNFETDPKSPGVYSNSNDESSSSNADDDKDLKVETRYSSTRDKTKTISEVTVIEQ